MTERTTPTELECVSTIVAAAIGELNSELTVVVSALSTCLEEMNTGGPSALLEDALAAAQRAGTDVARLMAFARWAGGSPVGNLSEILSLLKTDPC